MSRRTTTDSPILFPVITRGADIFTPATPPLVRSPASPISPAVSITSFDLEKFSGDANARFDSAAPAPHVTVHGVYSAKAFDPFFLVSLLSFLSSLDGSAVFYDLCTAMFQDDLVGESESCSSFPSRLHTLYIITYADPLRA